MKKIIALCLLCLAVALPAAAASTSVTLAWDANPEPDVAGYRLYYATVSGGPYSQAGTVTHPTTQWTHTGLADGMHCWVATAYDTAGNESGYSNEVCMTADATPPGVPQTVRITVTVRVE